MAFLCVCSSTCLVLQLPIFWRATCVGTPGGHGGLWPSPPTTIQQNGDLYRFRAWSWMKFSDIILITYNHSKMIQKQCDVCFFPFLSSWKKILWPNPIVMEAQLSRGQRLKVIPFFFTEATPKSLGKKNIFCWLDFSGLILTCVEKNEGKLIVLQLFLFRSPPMWIMFLT